MRVLWVLMWKHAVVRSRRYINTVADVFGPLGFFLLIFLLQHYIISYIPSSGNIQGNTTETEIIPLSIFEPKPYWLAYSPDTPLAESIMDEVGQKLNLKKLSSNPDYKLRGYFPLPKGTKLVDIAAKMKPAHAVIRFEGMEGETLPAKLKYYIRMKGDFHTEEERALEDNPINTPKRIFSYQYGTFMIIQWAIDTSYIKELTDVDVPQNLSLQSFPEAMSNNRLEAAVFCAVLGIACWLSLLLTFVFHMGRLLRERTTGIQELMKMVGVSLNTLGISHYLNVLPIGVVFAIGGTMICKISNKPMVPETSGILMCLVLFLYFNSVMAMACVCSYISKRTEHTVSLSSLTYGVLYMPSRFLKDKEIKYSFKVLTGFLPHEPMNWFWSHLLKLEYTGKGANFSNLTESHNYHCPPILVGCVFLILQTLICYALAWYLSKVRPGEYGQAMPWNFLFKREYWTKRGVAPDEDEEDLIPRRDARYFERGPANTEVGIKVIDVSKAYPKHKALNKVSLEVYKGEITVLVGHNGAGKTTLMSIITGMTSATEGKVLVNGKDTVGQKDQVLRNIGHCPQHNLFFQDLTLREHIMFFTMLKGGTYSEAKQSSAKLADQLGLSDKLDALTKELSGGMKRRAQLACALAGGADVLVLDEPTSGLDVETRRGLWDLLLSLRDNRTVLLSTHFMEEADALGDRVAALHSGVLRCFATPMHLKKAIGTGYRLSLTTIGVPKQDEITEVVKSHVPDATLKEQTNNSLSYNLPSAYSGNFSKLFSNLEEERSKLQIDSIGVGVSTLEEVFLKLCSDTETMQHDDETDNASAAEVRADKLKGFPLYIRQYHVLFKRQIKYAMHKQWVFLALQLIVPIIMICVITKMVNKEASREPRALPMNLDAYGGTNVIVYRLDSPHITDEDVLKVQLKWIGKGIFRKVAGDVAKKVQELSKVLGVAERLLLAGFESDALGFKVLSSTTRRHAAPVALNILSNLLAAHHISWSDGNTITTFNDPISREFKAAIIKEPKDLMSVITWGICLIFVILATNINNISLPCKERQTGARHIHIMSGCPVELHWLATLSFHMLCAVALIIPTVLAANFLDADDTFCQPDMLGALAVVLFVGCMAFMALCYFVSLNLGERSGSILLITLVVLFGFASPPTKVLPEFGFVPDESSADDKRGIQYYLMYVISLFMTPHLISETTLKCLNVGRVNAMCDMSRELCPALFFADPAFDTEVCCAGGKPQCYFCLTDFSPGLGIILMLLHFLFFMVLVILTERGYFNGLKDTVLNSIYKPDHPPDTDEMVRAEKAYVSKAITLPTNRIPDAMLVDDLHKNYVGCCKVPVNAIKGVSFSVKKGECFGLLGVNGAGKSTCFKMMTAEECPTRGKIFANGYLFRRGNNEYLQTLGYCPQFFGLDMFQTGEENLAMVLTLRGFHKQEVEREIRNWIQIVGLEKYARRRVEGYSGGCVRRLGTASALCGGAQLALLDEPTAGVDVAARRRLWTALRRALRSQRAVVITSHSMDEMEALCSRIAILAGGRVRALGTAAALRAAHAQGHAVVFKIKHASSVVVGDEVDGSKTQVNKFKGQLQEMFNCTLKDEHMTMLHYHINETLRYSTLFAQLETLRAQFPTLLEDYSVTETTLEEVFLAFAKEQQSSGTQAV